MEEASGRKMPLIQSCSLKNVNFQGRPSVPSRRTIMDERLNEKLCPPEDLLKMEKITKDNLHTYLHLKAESSEEKLENLKFLARLVLG